MNVWMFIAIWLILENAFATLKSAMEYTDFAWDDIVMYTIGGTIFVPIMWPMAIVKFVQSFRKSAKKKEQKNTEDNTIGFKTKAEILAMEARKSEL